MTDPPYALVSITKRFGKPGAKPATGDVYRRAGAGFMSQTWDTGDTAFDPAFWREVIRVLKPGGHLAAFGGTRTYHRLVCAIEDAGFEIRDQLAWIYGTGFPKSHNQRDIWDGFGTALKPAFEPIVLARKPLDGTVAENLARWGVGALSIEACRIQTTGSRAGGDRGGEGSADRVYADRGATTFTVKPGPRGGDARGRWPANVIHDGSDEVVSAFPLAAGQRGAVNREQPRDGRAIYGAFSGERSPTPIRGDTGRASRFFYSAKATSAERAGSIHPTVKPVALMRWLCRLLAPPGAIILDPFAGSGTTGVAARREHQQAILIEREARYCADIEERLRVAA